MFIVFNTKSQALDYIKRNKQLTYSHHEGCGCCWFQSTVFIDGNKVVQSNVACSQGDMKASATVIGKIKKRGR
jgi:uncharacterized cysteine cluster protein YcgN (CxxCxxCC family)